jgi:uncharacterized membrane protein YhaH (DUF805 family)
MTAIVAPILYSFRNLARFSGRDRRDQFWPYAIFLFIVQNIVSMTAMIPVMHSVMSKTFYFTQQHLTAGGTRLRGADQKEFVQMMEGIFSDMQSLLMVTTPVLTGLFIVFIAAAAARRLHDRGKSGFWGLMPVPLAGFGVVLMPKTFSAFLTHDISAYWLVALFLNNILYFGFLIFLIVLLAQRSEGGANRYGADTQNRDFGDARARWGY